MNSWCNLPLDLLKKIDQHAVLYCDKIRLRCVCVQWQSTLPKLSNWGNLPLDLLKKIEEHNVLFVDKIRFKCVCVGWQSALSKLPDLRQPQLPWLLLPYDERSGSRCGFFNPLDKKVHELDLPEAGEKVFKGTYDGWVIVALDNASIYIVNPLSKARVQLPPRTKFPDVIKYRVDKHGNEFLLKQGRLKKPHYCFMDVRHVRNYMLEKIVLSSSPTSTDFVAVAMYADITRLAYCKYGDKKWSPLLAYENPERGFDDVIFSEGKLYALNFDGQLLVWDDVNSSSRLRILVSHHPTKMNENYHLVHSHVGFMMIYRDQTITRVKQDPEEKYISKTHGFNNIYRLNMSTSSWIPMETLGDNILFMGFGTQLCAYSCSFPEYKGNTVYFAGDRLNFNCEGVENCFDEGICNLDNGMIQSLIYTCHPHLVWPSPVWVMPNPY